MSDPTEANQANPHPVSQHRTPREIALDEAGPIGRPDRDVVSKEAGENAPRFPAARRAPRAAGPKKRRKGR